MGRVILILPIKVTWWLQLELAAVPSAAYDIVRRSASLHRYRSPYDSASSARYRGHGIFKDRCGCWCKSGFQLSLIKIDQVLLDQKISLRIPKLQMFGYSLHQLFQQMQQQRDNKNHCRNLQLLFLEVHSLTWGPKFLQT